MKIMTHMHTKKAKHKYKKRIIVSAAVVIATLAALTVVFLLVIKKPQIKLVMAMRNTLASSENSAFNETYGLQSMLSLMTDSMRLSYESDKTDLSILRSADEHECLVELYSKDMGYKLYVNDKTSIAYIGDMAVKIPYTDNLATNMSNSFVVALSGMDSEEIGEFARSYENLMRAAADNYTDDSGQYRDIMEETVSYLMNIESSREGKKNIEIGGQTERCRLYLVKLDMSEFNSYLDKCLGIYSDAIDNADDIVHDINQLAGDIMSEGELDIYFAINRRDELVSMYAEDASESGVDFSLTFDGEDYVAQSWSFSIGDDSGRQITIEGSDISEGSVAGFTANLSYIPEAGAAAVSRGLELRIDGNAVDFDIIRDGDKTSCEAELEDFEKGRYMDIRWADGSIHIGCDLQEITRPEYDDSIDLFDTDILSSYSFVSKLKRQYGE